MPIGAHLLTGKVFCHGLSNWVSNGDIGRSNYFLQLSPGLILPW